MWYTPLSQTHPDERPLLVSCQATILSCRYVSSYLSSYFYNHFSDTTSDVTAAESFEEAVVFCKGDDGTVRMLEADGAVASGAE